MIIGLPRANKIDNSHFVDQCGRSSPKVAPTTQNKRKPKHSCQIQFQLTTGSSTLLIVQDWAVSLSRQEAIAVTTATSSIRQLHLMSPRWWLQRRLKTPWNQAAPRGCKADIALRLSITVTPHTGFNTRPHTTAQTIVPSALCLHGQQQLRRPQSGTPNIALDMTQSRLAYSSEMCGPGVCVFSNSCSDDSPPAASPGICSRACQGSTPRRGPFRISDWGARLTLSPDPCIHFFFFDLCLIS